MIIAIKVFGRYLTLETGKADDEDAPEIESVKESAPADPPKRQLGFTVEDD